MKYIVVVYQLDGTSPLTQVAAHEEDAMTPDDAIEQWATEIEEVRRS